MRITAAYGWQTYVCWHSHQLKLTQTINLQNEQAQPREYKLSPPVTIYRRHNFPWQISLKIVQKQNSWDKILNIKQVAAAQQFWACFVSSFSDE